MGEFYLSQIILFAGNFAPVGWLPCDGRLLSIAEYDALFSLLGTTYGGDGVSTFGLPDLRGAVPVSAGQATARGVYDLGQTGGAEAVTLTSANMPAHNHAATIAATINVTSEKADATSPKGNYFAQATASVYRATADANRNFNPAAATGTVTLGPTGGSQPLPVMMPFVAINYCICTDGLYPPRS